MNDTKICCNHKGTLISVARMILSISQEVKFRKLTAQEPSEVQTGKKHAKLDLQTKS